MKGGGEALARKIEPTSGGRGDHGGTHERTNRHGQWRQPQPRPTRAPQGEVKWWERAAPEESDPQLWAAVQRIQGRRQQLRMTVTDLARRLAGRGHPIRRETLSRVLNGKQPTTWETAEHMADLLGIDLVIHLDDDAGDDGAPVSGR